ncbi:STAS domain-containing protein [Spartinivicinus poritis]|uniref:STAS domain-containing protein n=1 Tax=Spartinivicinus poritis TaxID=2994640 RepID=A0ABT5U2I9_9GAMM|nr:STAS domain-containing protein [Spartinivicinus sp. A2-2]MDE1460582.1 STAS domain-containing protein [Spartinivicinus sp. A2-2]
MNKHTSPTLKTTTTGNSIIIRVGKEFTFKLAHAFRETYIDLKNHDYTYIVDLKETEYIDSSSLGILLNMKKHLNCSKEKIKIINCNNHITKLFALSKFDEAFIVQSQTSTHPQ